MDSKNQLTMMRTFSAGLAHDLNNAIGGISNLASASLLDAPQGPITDDLKQILATSRETLRLIAKLQLIGISKNPRKSTTLLSEALSAAQQALHIPKQRISIRFPESLSVYADPRLFREVLFALLQNALEASETTIQLEAKQDTNRLQLTISNTGKLPHPPEQLIQPYVSTKKEVRGKGLGLFVVFAIIEGHGGEFTLREENGTVFANIYLPTSAA